MSETRALIWGDNGVNEKVLIPINRIISVSLDHDADSGTYSVLGVDGLTMQEYVLAEGIEADDEDVVAQAEYVANGGRAANNSEGFAMGIAEAIMLRDYAGLAEMLEGVVVYSDEPNAGTFAEVAERIIARLESAKGAEENFVACTHGPTALNAAIRIVREECGVES